MLLISGAVSRGRYDFVPEVLDDLGVTVHLHGVRQRPGKPLLVCSREGRLVLELPGNPVASLVRARRYLVPVLAGERAGGFPVELALDLEYAKRLTFYPPLRLERAHGSPTGVPLDGNGSGDYSRLIGSSGIGIRVLYFAQFRQAADRADELLTGTGAGTRSAAEWHDILAARYGFALDRTVVRATGG